MVGGGAGGVYDGPSRCPVCLACLSVTVSLAFATFSQVGKVCLSALVRACVWFCVAFFSVSMPHKMRRVLLRLYVMGVSICCAWSRTMISQGTNEIPNPRLV